MTRVCADINKETYENNFCSLIKKRKETNFRAKGKAIRLNYNLKTCQMFLKTLQYIYGNRKCFF